jgi:RNA polymerase II-associated protein 1
MLILRRRVPLSRSQLLFTCMKVFMLEHGQSTLENGEEVYQNPVVGQLMLEVLQPLRLSSKLDASHSWISDRNPTLDAVAKSFLGPEQPFYQFYSDFLGLYDSSSFGHKLFGTLALPPTSQVYPKDYRKLLWGDYGHTLRSIQADVPEMFATRDELKHWLWPVEGRRDGEMLGHYVKALVKGHVTGFLRFVAIHQVASCLWPDLTETSDGVSASKLLRAILTSSDESLLREILYYRQSSEGGELVVPPHCYEPLSSLVSSRLDWVASTAGESVRNRFPSA